MRQQTKPFILEIKHCSVVANAGKRRGLVYSYVARKVLYEAEFAHRGKAGALLVFIFYHVS